MQEGINYLDLAKQAAADGKFHLIKMYAKNHARVYKRKLLETRKGAAATAPINGK